MFRSSCTPRTFGSQSRENSQKRGQNDDPQQNCYFQTPSLLIKRTRNRNGQLFFDGLIDDFHLHYFENLTLFIADKTQPFQRLNISDVQQYPNKTYSLLTETNNNSRDNLLQKTSRTLSQHKELEEEPNNVYMMEGNIQQKSEEDFNSYESQEYHHPQTNMHLRKQDKKHCTILIQMDNSIASISKEKFLNSQRSASKKNKKRDDVLSMLVEQVKSIKEKDENKDLTLISDTILQLIETVTHAQKNEIELGMVMKDITKHEKEKLRLQIESQFYKKQNQLGNQETNIYRQKNMYLEQNIKALQKQILKLQNENNDLRKKNVQYEKRIDLFVEQSETKETNQIVSFSAQKLPSMFLNSDNQKTVLQELSKENENLKKNLKLKEKEVERLKEMNVKYQDKITYLQKKIEVINLKRSAGNQPQKMNSLKQFDEGKFNIEDFNFCPTIDFKTQCLPMQQQNFLSDIGDKGKEIFLSSMDDEKKGQMELIINNMASFKDFSYKFNFIVQEIFYLLSMNNTDQIMIFIARSIALTLKADNVHLWMRESETGILKTLNKHSREIKAFETSGILSRCIQSLAIINCTDKKGINIYQKVDGEQVTGDGCVLFPLLMGKDNIKYKDSTFLIGVLEISGLQKDQFSLDEQYLSIVLAKFITSILKKIKEFATLFSKERIADQNQEFFQVLCQSKSKQQFSNVIAKYAKDIFLSGASQFAFFESNIITVYSQDLSGEEETNEDSRSQDLKRLSENEFNEFKIKTYKSHIGLVGKVIHEQRPAIFFDSKRQPNFQQDLDIQSMLPVYYHPILITKQEQTPLSPRVEEVVGVIQIVLKNRKRILNHHPQQNIEYDFGLLNPDADYHIFCKYVKTAYSILYNKQ